MTALTAHARPLLHAAIGLVLPPRCLACGEIVGAQGDLCAPCWQPLRFIQPPFCPGCAVPLRGDPSQECCAACQAAPPPWRQARAAVAYDEASRRIVLGFKHYARLEAAPLLARWLSVAGEDVLAEAELLVPVPAHRWRLARRGYNQAALLAQRLSALAGVPALLHGLVRTRATASQQGLGAEARRDNITPAHFTVRPRAQRQLAGRRVVLLDDVLTTGATLAACTAVLQEHGALTVDVLAVARTVAPGAVA